MKRFGVAAAYLSGIVALSGVAATAPALPASAAACARASASAITVAVVVDFGDGSAPSTVCVPAESADNGAAVLAARAEQLGTPPPRFDSSGFVCGIDGDPADGCGEQTGSTYAYWSYWHGTGSWEYSNVGPGGSRVHANIVEGWRFQPHGAGNPSDPPPSGSPDASTICSPSPTTTTSASSTATDQAVVVLPTTSVTTTTTVTTTMTTVTSTEEASTTSTASQVAGAVRVTTPGQSGTSGGSSPWPAISAGVVIVGFAAGGVVLARRRGSPPG